MTIQLDSQGLLVDGRRVPVYAGAVHYWRLEREAWPQIFDQIQALGFEMLETYIPWSVHEIAPGKFDWGQIDPRKDLAAFMRLCEERGLWLIVRPGPLINAELTDFGFPEWVLLDPAMQARTAQDTLHYSLATSIHPPHQFPVPSYASPEFLAATAGWLDALCPRLEPHLAPRGCIVAMQSDNETCYMFHDQPYATDYSAGSLALYREFLAERYPAIAALNELYGTRYADWSAVEPPRDCTIATRQDVPAHIDWVAYKEYQIIWCVARIATLLRERGMTVPMFHDVAFQYRSPLDVVAMEADPAIDWVGSNYYREPAGYADAVYLIRYLAGSTRLPLIPEFGSGGWIHRPHVPFPDEQAFITLAALMHGVKAFSLYMLVERERWLASPITRHGDLRPGYAEFYQTLLSLLQERRFWEFQRTPQVLLLHNFDLDRFRAATTTLHYAHVDLLDLPPQLLEVEIDLGLRWAPDHCGPDAPAAWHDAVLTTLHAAQVDYNVSDTHLSLERLQAYPLICLECADFLDRSAQERLRTYVEQGGTLLIGPGMPDLDAQLRPCTILADAADAAGEHLRWLQAPELATALPALLPPPAITTGNPAIELTLHRRGSTALVFLANPTRQPQDARLVAASGRLSPVYPPATSAATAFTLAPWTVQIWEMQP